MSPPVVLVKVMPKRLTKYLNTTLLKYCELLDLYCNLSAFSDIETNNKFVSLTLAVFCGLKSIMNSFVSTI